MPNITTEFMAEWQKFLPSIGRAAKKSLTKRNNPKFEPLRSLLDDVLSELQSAEAITAMREAVGAVRRPTKDAQILVFLTREMQFVNGLCTEDGPSDADADDATGSAKTVKDSIHKFVKIPKWLEKLLDILNELLSILRGGG